MNQIDPRRFVKTSCCCEQFSYKQTEDQQGSRENDNHIVTKALSILTESFSCLSIKTKTLKENKHTVQRLSTGPLRLDISEMILPKRHNSSSQLGVVEMQLDTVSMSALDRVEEEIETQIEGNHPESFETSPISFLPPELLLKIFIGFEPKDVSQVTLVNHSFNRLGPDLFAHYYSTHPFKGSAEALMKMVRACGSQLKSLDLSQCNSIVAIDMLQEIGLYCPSLKRLNLAHSSINSLEFLSNFPQLKELDLSFCHTLPAETFKYLRNMEKLKILALAQTQIANLGYLPRDLCSLNLNCCQKVPQTGFQPLSKIASLRRLNLSSTWIKSIGDLPITLYELDISSCKHIKTIEFRELRNMLHLRKLILVDTQIEQLRDLPNWIIKLDLSWCDNLSAVSFKNWDSSSLQVLKLKGRVVDIKSFLSEINSLDLNWSQKIPSNGF